MVSKSLNQRPTQNSRPSKSLVNSRPTAVEARPKTIETPQEEKPVVPAENIAIDSSMPMGDKKTVLDNFVEAITGMVGPFAILNGDTIAKNMDLANGNGMSMEDRTISFECARYVVANMAYIIMGLVVNKSFKKSFMENVSLEIALDSKSESEKTTARKKMTSNKTYDSTGALVIGISTFTPAVEKQLFAEMEQGFDELMGYTQEFDKRVNTMGDDEKLEYGFIFSNFMYLIRAFSHNDVFMGYVIDTIEKVKEKNKQ